MYVGRVVRYNARAGYGFIRRSRFEEDVFVHRRQVVDGDGLAEGVWVEFTLGHNPAQPKRLCAFAVRIIDDPAASPYRAHR